MVADLDKRTLYHYYQLKGYYYSNYSYNKAVMSFTEAYNLLPNDENLKKLEVQKKPNSSFIIDYGGRSVIRGGALPEIETTT